MWYIFEGKKAGQAVINRLEISASPGVLIGLNGLETVLISKIILFKKENYAKR